VKVGEGNYLLRYVTFVYETMNFLISKTKTKCEQRPLSSGANQTIFCSQSHKSIRALPASRHALQ
jgi:hypothetical protein